MTLPVTVMAFSLAGGREGGAAACDCALFSTVNAVAGVVVFPAVFGAALAVACGGALFSTVNVDSAGAPHVSKTSASMVSLFVK